jgi:plastocyanin
MLPPLLLILSLTRVATAAEVSVQIHDRSGRPISDAVVTLTSDSPSNTTTSTVSKEKVIDQRNETFVPYVELFHPGDRVVFRNSDRTRHHVYSFSHVKTFEFVLKPGESSPALMLDQTGIAAVGCNIHDHMISYLFVTDAPRADRSGGSGTVKFGELPSGSYTLHVWHPQLHPGHPEMAQTIGLVAESDRRSVDFVLSLLPDPRQHLHGDNEY